MRIKLLLLSALLTPTFAGAEPALVAHDHGGGIFHAFRLETDVGTTTEGDPTHRWDLDGWIGGDTEKLWLKSEGELVDGRAEQAEFWALYSRNIATFWDVQAGARQDLRPHSHSYFVAGISGLAPYGFETEAHVFLRTDGAASARLRQEIDLLLTQRLILQPYGELNLSSRSDATDGVGSGLTDLHMGVQTRYEFTRNVAPYMDIRYERQFGDTADYAAAEGESTHGVALALGLRLLF